MARRLSGTDGKEKMSKSLWNCIYLSDDADTVWKKVKHLNDPSLFEHSWSWTCRGEMPSLLILMLSKSNKMRLAEISGLNLSRVLMSRSRLYSQVMVIWSVRNYLNSVLKAKMLSSLYVHAVMSMNRIFSRIYNILKKASTWCPWSSSKDHGWGTLAMQINYFEWDAVDSKSGRAIQTEVRTAEQYSSSVWDGYLHEESSWMLWPRFSLKACTAVWNRMICVRFVMINDTPQINRCSFAS